MLSGPIAAFWYAMYSTYTHIVLTSTGIDKRVLETGWTGRTIRAPNCPASKGYKGGNTLYDYACAALLCRLVSGVLQKFVQEVHRFGVKYERS